MRLSKKQIDWLQKASPAEVKAFMVKGEAEGQLLFNFQTNEEYYGAYLHGIRLGNDRFTSCEDAKKHAQKEKMRLMQENLPDIPDRILINHSKTAEAACDHNVRLAVAFHLGAVLGIDTPSQQFEDEFLGNLKDIAGDLKELSLTAIAKKGERARNLHEEVAEHCLDRGTLGWVIHVDTPVPRKGGIYSWGTYWSKWFYGETFDDAWAKALKWADKKSEVPA